MLYVLGIYSEDSHGPIPADLVEFFSQAEDREEDREEDYSGIYSEDSHGPIPVNLVKLFSQAEDREEDREEDHEEDRDTQSKIGKEGLSPLVRLPSDVQKEDQDTLFKLVNRGLPDLVHLHGDGPWGSDDEHILRNVSNCLKSCVTIR